MSHSQVLRLSTLHLMSSPIIEPAGCIEVVKRSLVAEQVPLSVQGVRERILRSTKVGQAVHNDDETAAELCARWLLGSS